MKIINKSQYIAAAFIAVAAATNVHAEEGLYAGVGVSYGEAKSNDGMFGFESKDGGAAVGATLGYRFERGNVFFGPELDAEFFVDGKLDVNGRECSAGAVGPYYCERNAVYRIRGVVGGAIGGEYEWFGTLGYGVVAAKGATSAATQDDGISGGLTLGAGVQRGFGASGMIRVEAIYDDFSDTIDRPKPPLGAGFSPDYEATSIKASVLFSF